MVNIHPTAIVDPRARLGAGCTVGAFAVIEGDVELGENTDVGHHSIIMGPLTAGTGNRFYPHCVIGADGQYPGATLLDLRRIVIGSDNVFREQVTVHQPTTTPLTRIGDHGYFMVQTHISHDASIGHNVKMAMGVTLAGFVTVDDWAYLGMGASVHQRTRIGAHAMVGMNSAVRKHVPPGAVLVGQTFSKLNSRGLQSRGVSDEALAKLTADFSQSIGSERSYQMISQGAS